MENVIPLGGSPISPNPYQTPSVTDPSTSTDQLAQRIHPVVRFFSALLMITGFVFLPAALMLPLLIPGVAVWFGYCLIAFGSRSTNSQPFWITSLVWNVIALIIWYTIRASDANFSYVTEHYPLIHSFLAIVFSGISTRIAPEINSTTIVP